MSENQTASVTTRVAKLEGWVSWILSPHGIATISALMLALSAAITTFISEANRGIAEPPVASTPIVPPRGKLVLYLTAPNDAPNDLLTLPVSVTTDPKTYLPGSTYPWQGRLIPVPCAAIHDANGKVLDVRTIGTTAEMAAWVRQHTGQ